MVRSLTPTMPSSSGDTVVVTVTVTVAVPISMVPVAPDATRKAWARA
jgi:hypothetical protein